MATARLCGRPVSGRSSGPALYGQSKARRVLSLRLAPLLAHSCAFTLVFCVMLLGMMKSVLFLRTSSTFNPEFRYTNDSQPHPGVKVLLETGGVAAIESKLRRVLR